LVYAAAAVLGVVQGLTEFLPVSSSAHLILARAFFGWDTERLGLAFDVACHVGTLAAVLCYFRADLVPLAAAIPAGLSGGAGPQARMVRLVAAGTVPIVLFGLAAADRLEELREPLVCAITLTIGAVLMMVAERARRGTRTADDVTLGEAFGIGVGQALALFPGMSRSGTTIAIALLMGVQRQAAARFTFLMSIPAVLAAAGREAWALAGAGTASLDPGLFLTGALVSGLVGYLAIAQLIRYLARHSLDVFAYYRFALAAVVAVWLLRQAR
jgi:undecaprenyl-diphosphatase